MKYQEEIDKLIKQAQKCEEERDRKWNNMAKVFGVDVNDKQDIQNFRQSDQWDEYWKKDFETAYSEYSALQENVNNTSMKVTVVKTMERNLITSWEEAEAAVTFTMELLELYTDNLKKTEPQATKTIADLDKAYNALMDVQELVEEE